MVSEEYRQKNGFTPEQIANTMERFYDRVDAATQKTVDALAHDGFKLHCQKGCCACCRDDLTVTQGEAALIRNKCGDVLNEIPHKKGACAFLDESGACRIYAVRPYICRTHGLPLRWTDEDENGDDCEERDICDLNRHIDLVALMREQCWTLGLPELQLSQMNRITFGNDERVSLRALFNNLN